MIHHASLPAALVASALLAGGIPAVAQLHGSVAVEGEYAPEIIDVERINQYPQQIRFDLPAGTLPYERRGIVADFTPSILTMGITGWRTLQPLPDTRGYVDLRLGSWLDSNLSAGYRALSDSVSRLDIALQFNSTSLWRSPQETPGTAEHDRRQLYDGTLSADYVRSLGEHGIVDATLAYRLGYFNYYASPVTAASGAPTQTLNNLRLHAGWGSAPDASGRWNAAAEVEYFGYRALYGSLESPEGGYPALKGDRETRVELDGGYALDLGSDARSGIFELQGRLAALFYGSREKTELPGFTLPGSPESYAMLTLNPRYTFERDNFLLRIGAVADITINASGSGGDDHYSLFHIAPDLRVDWRKGGVGFHVSASGGSRLQTLSYLSRYDYYGLPALVSTQPAYTPLAAEIGLEAGPFSGFTAGLAWGYDVTLHTPAGGWYQAMLGTPVAGLEGIPSPLYSTSGKGVDLHGMQARVRLAYRSGTRFELSAEGRYTPQNGRKGVFDGYDRARWNLTASLMWRPVDKLRIDASWLYRGVRNIYMYGLSRVVGQVAPEETLYGFRLPDLTDLQAGVTWTAHDRLDIGCHVYNILNRHTTLLPGLPSEGICVAGGLTLRF